MTSTAQSSSSNTVPLSVYLIIALGVMSVAAAAIFIRFAQSDGIPSLLIAAGRLVIATIILTPLVLRRHMHTLRRMTRRDIALSATSGVFLAVHFATWISSLEFTTVLVSVVFVTTSPLWVALLEVTFLKEQLTRLIVAGLLIAITGGVLIGLAGSDGAATPAEPNHLLGGALALLGALTVSVYLIVGRKLRATMPLLPYIWLAYGFGGLTLLLAVIFTGTPITGHPTNGYIAIILTAVIPQLIGHTAFNYAVGFVPATMVSMATQLEPIGSALLAFLLFSEMPAPLQIVGSAIILTGVTLANYGQTQRTRMNRVNIT